MENALALLIATSLASTGLLAAWAATSSRNWFFRTVVYLGLLALVLVIPAVEVFVAFVLQGVVVVTGVWVARHFRRSAIAENQSKPTRYSLLTMLQITSLVAVAAAVVTKAPPLNWPAWQSVLLIGSMSGIATLLALWVVHGRLVRWWLRVAVCVVLTPIFSVPLVWGDWLFVSFETFESWPPEVYSSTILQSLGEEWTALIWIPTYVSLILCMMLFFSLWHLAVNQTISSPAYRSSSRVGLSAVALLIALPPTVMYYKMVTPLTIPIVEMPKHNGYDDIIAAAEMLEGTPVVTGNIDYEFATKKQLQLLVDTSSEARERAREGLARPCVAPVDYTSAEAFDEYFQVKIHFSDLVIAHLAYARLAKFNANYELALQQSLDVIKLGYAIRNKGLMIDGLIGIGRTYAGLGAIFRLRGKLSSHQCLAAIQQIKSISENSESFADFWYRESVWMQHVTGWHGRLKFYLEEFSGDYESFSDPNEHRNRFLAQQARIQLLITELALQAYQTDNGSRPDSLEQLIPKYLDKVPADPLDPNGGLLHYRTDKHGYALYSVGLNEVDDDGAIPPKDVDGNPDREQGDLRLDSEFAPTEPEVIPVYDSPNAEFYNGDTSLITE